jgi:hypothetical protein
VVEARLESFIRKGAEAAPSQLSSTLGRCSRYKINKTRISLPAEPRLGEEMLDWLGKQVRDGIRKDSQTSAYGHINSSLTQTTHFPTERTHRLLETKDTQDLLRGL